MRKKPYHIMTGTVIAVGVATSFINPAILGIGIGMLLWPKIQEGMIGEPFFDKEPVKEAESARTKEIRNEMSLGLKSKTPLNVRSKRPVQEVNKDKSQEATHEKEQ